MTEAAESTGGWEEEEEPPYLRIPGEAVLRSISLWTPVLQNRVSVVLNQCEAIPNSPGEAGHRKKQRQGDHFWDMHKHIIKRNAVSVPSKERKALETHTPPARHCGRISQEQLPRCYSHVH